MSSYVVTLVYIYIYIYIYAHTLIFPYLCVLGYFVSGISTLVGYLVPNPVYVLVSWPSAVVGDPKAPFSITTTLRCRGERYYFPWIATLTLDQYPIILSVKHGGILYHFWVCGMTRAGIEPRSLASLANTLIIMSMGWSVYIYIYIYIYVYIHILSVNF